MVSRTIRWHLGVVLGLLALSLLAPVALAQNPAPPATGAAVIEESFASPGFFIPIDCASGRGGLHYVGEGLRMRLNGRCHDALSSRRSGR